MSTLLDEVKARTTELQQIAAHPVPPDPRIARTVQGSLLTLLSSTALELGKDPQLAELLRGFDLTPEQAASAVARGALSVARQLAAVHMQSVNPSADMLPTVDGQMALVCRGPNPQVVCMSKSAAVVLTRMLAGEDVLIEFAGQVLA